MRPASEKLTVYYDGACPLCRREIDYYRRRRRFGAVEWVDVSACEAALLGPDLGRAEALARFHVRLPDGRLVSGARGFGALWARLGGLRWLGRVADVPAAAPALEAAYRTFLRVRPMVQRLAAKLEA